MVVLSNCRTPRAPDQTLAVLDSRPTFCLDERHRLSQLRVTYFDTTMHLGYENAVGELRTWGWTERLLKRHDRLLKQQGIELPFEHLIRCEKEKHRVE